MASASIGVGSMTSVSHARPLASPFLAWPVVALAVVAAPIVAMLMLIDAPAPARLALAGGPILAVGLTGVSVRAEMEAELAELNSTLLRNPTVRLNFRRRHPTSVTPLKPQPEQPTLGTVRGDLGRGWPMTGLLDMLKKCTAAPDPPTDVRDPVQERLLLVESGLAAFV
jgi:hypothetical protein